MMNLNAEEWLPPGWTVKVKMRKRSKKDKYYIEPSSQMRFNSRAEVFRYLKTAAICHPESQDWRPVKQPGNNVEVQKTLANGLPPGWIKETRETRTANRMRRDSFYIDPVNGNALRSIRDVHRYLTTGKVSRLAYKSKSQKGGDIEFQHDDISISALESPAVPKKEMQAIGKARRQIIWSENLSEPSEVTNEETIFPNATIFGESMPISEHNSSHGGIGTEVHCSTLPECKDLEQSDQENDFSESIQHKCAIDDGPTKNESRKRQRKTKEDVNLPRRASKRLAGLEAEPVLEVKTSRRAHLGACEEFEKQVASTIKSAYQCPENTDVKHETNSINDKSLDSSRKEHICVDLPKRVKKMKSEDVHEQDVLEKRVGEIESEDKADVKQGSLLKLPVEDLLTDPCIAFAVKTLTGGVFEASISSEASQVPNNIDHPSAAFTPNEMRNLGPENKPSPELPVSRVGKVENYNVVEKLESTSELVVGEILADPCIEFAIKTLTGEIPLDMSPDIEDYFHQLSSSNTANTSNRIGSDYIYKSNVLSQKPQVIQALEASPNINFQSCGTGLHQERNENNELQRH